MNVFELFGKIAIDSNEAERGLNKTVGHAKNAEGALEKTFKRIAGFVAAAFSVKAIVDFGKACTQVYADVAAEQAAFAQIMGDYSDVAQQKLDAVADKTGITASRMTGSYNALTAKFMGLGYSVEDATTLATDGLMIAADASAFWNMSMDEAMAHLNSFINGSYEGGEAIGLFANDTQMAAYAVQQGFVADAKAWAQLDEATKQAIRLNFAQAMQESSGVTGQAANEADAYANVLANVAENWRQLQAIIGKPILEKIVLPAMRKLNEFMPIVSETVQNGIDWLSEGFDKIASYFSEVFTEDGLDMKAFPNALRNMFRDAARSIPALLFSVGRSIHNAWVNTVWPAVQDAIKVAFGIDLPEWNKIESAVITWWSGEGGIAGLIADACNWTLKLFDKPADVTAEDVKTILGDWWKTAKGFVSDACDWTLKLFTNPVEAYEDVKKTVGVWWQTVKGGAEAALDWTLKLFGVPTEDAEKVKTFVAAWWSGVKEGAEAALEWVLKLFANPVEAYEDVKTAVDGWWQTVKSGAEAALEWTLKLFGVPEEDAAKVKTFVGNWWSGVKSGAEAALEWVLQIFQNPAKTAEQVKSHVKTWWDTVKSGATAACSWVLQMFGLPPGDPVLVVKDWWEGVRADIEAALDIDLSKIDVAGIFTAATDAIGGVIEAAKTFYTNIVNAIAFDAEGKTNLNRVLDGLFQAGLDAMDDLSKTAANLISGIATAITGDEESAKKIGAVFSEMFSWAGEIASNTWKDITTLFDWILNNGELFAAAIGAIATKLILLAAANPAIAVISSIIALIGVMTTDWENFEQNYPELVEMFEQLTKLDFSDVSNTMEEFKNTLRGVFEFLATHRSELNMMLIAAGALAFSAGHPLLGSALISAGGYGTWEETIEKGKEDGFVPDEELEEKIVNTLMSDEGRAAYKRGDNESYGIGDRLVLLAAQLFGNSDVQSFLHGLPDTYRDYVDRLIPGWGIGTKVGGFFHDYAAEKINILVDKAGGLLDSWFGGSSGDSDGGSHAETITFDPENYVPANSNGMQSMLQNVMAQMKQEVTAGAQEGVSAGLSGVTIEVKATTSDVVLNDGTVVGKLATKINAALGMLNQRSGRVTG